MLAGDSTKWYMAQPLHVIGLPRKERFLKTSGVKVIETQPDCTGACSHHKSIQVRGAKGMEEEISLMCLGMYWEGTVTLC